MRRLTKFKLLYLCTPYTKYPAGLDRAFIDAAILCSRLLEAGVVCYSPVVHTHPIAHFGEINKTDHDYWLAVDSIFLERCDAVLIATMPTWEDSVGIAQERNMAREAGMPAFFIDPITLIVTEDAHGAAIHSARAGLH